MEDHGGQTFGALGRRRLLATASAASLSGVASSPGLSFAAPWREGGYPVPQGGAVTYVLARQLPAGRAFSFAVIGYGAVGVAAAGMLAGCQRFAPAAPAQPGSANLHPVPDARSMPGRTIADTTAIADPPRCIRLLLCDATDEIAFAAASSDAALLGEAQPVFVLAAGEPGDARTIPRPRRHTRLFTTQCDETAKHLAAEAEDFAASFLKPNLLPADTAEMLRLLGLDGSMRGAEGMLSHITCSGFCDEDDRPLPGEVAKPDIDWHILHTIGAFELDRRRVPDARLPCLLQADVGIMAHLVLPEDGSSQSVDILRDALTTAIKEAPEARHWISTDVDIRDVGYELIPLEEIAPVSPGDSGSPPLAVDGGSAERRSHIQTVVEPCPVFTAGGQVPKWPFAITCETGAVPAGTCRVQLALVAREPEEAPSGAG